MIGIDLEYEAVLEIDPDHVDARVALGIALRGQGEHRKARRHYKRVLDLRPNHPDALFNLAVLQAEFLDKRTESRQLFQRFLEAAPSNHDKRERAERYLKEIPAPEAASAAGSEG
jgi:tetratricopeptide (TPR) repeat protein